MTDAARTRQTRPSRKTRPVHPISPLLFAVLWCILITSLAAFQLWRSGIAISERSLAVVLIFAAGSFSGALFARAFCAICGFFRPQPSARFAAMLIGLSAGTVGLSALLHYLQFQSYYAQWHNSPFSRAGLDEIIMTGASSGYIFLVEATPLLLPWGLILLLAAAWDYAVSTR
ncbi:hypothetical protein [Roseibium suaedae]|uniref:Uncharacterized protein n=1 Tax=Roseibium suaedae TaxID=735517 RepID=A0A1M7G8W6_9HYPH|nr:hypothetical protein [Roseibium suaedae]SHM12730.1 hypothetical protein SAMN05444272_1845 [Roseibium suaedae]